MTKQDY